MQYSPCDAINGRQHWIAFTNPDRLIVKVILIAFNLVLNCSQPFTTCHDNLKQIPRLLKVFTGKNKGLLNMFKHSLVILKSQEYTFSWTFRRVTSWWHRGKRKEYVIYGGLNEVHDIHLLVSLPTDAKFYLPPWNCESTKKLLGPKLSFLRKENTNNSNNTNRQSLYTFV